MKASKLYIFFMQIYLYKSLLIKNKKPCSECKYFIYGNNECRKLENIDLITGKNINEKASIIRYDETKCGKEGKYFEQNYFKIITVPYYFILDNPQLIFPYTFSFMYFIFILYSYTK